MWPECVADFATAVDQSTLPHHSFKPRKELRGQSVIAGERLVIFGNKRFTHCDLFSRANQASLPVGEPERWRIGGCALSGFYGSHREQRMCPRATAETAGEFGIGMRAPKGSAWVNLRTLSAKARTSPGRRVRLDR